MNLISDIRLKWYDDSSLMTDDPRELLELFLDSLGVSSAVACDVLEVLLLARQKDISLTSSEISTYIKEVRKKRRQAVGKGLTDRNIQLWLKFFIELQLVDRLGRRYRFKNNRSLGEAFNNYTKPLVIESLDYVNKVINKLERAYSINNGFRGEG